MDALRDIELGRVSVRRAGGERRGDLDRQPAVGADDL
jgi:hypothetical protein